MFLLTSALYEKEFILHCVKQDGAFLPKIFYEGVDMKRQVKIIVAAMLAFVFILGATASADTARDQYEEGYKHYKKKEFHKALEYFDKAIEANKGYVKAYLYRGVTYFMLDNHQKALKDFNKAVELDPDNFMALFYRGQAYFYTGHSKKAIEDYKRALQKQPENAKIFIQMATAYYRLGNLKETVSYASKTISYAPKHPGAFMLRGAAYWRQGNLDAAIRDFKMAKNLVPDSPKTQLFYYIAKARNGDKYTGELKKFYKRTKDRKWPFPAVALILDKITPEECVKAALKDAKNDTYKNIYEAQAHFYIAWNYLIEGDEDKAEEFFKKAMNDHAKLFMIQGVIKDQLAKMKD